MNYFKHESSYVDENVTIGNNTKIWHFSHILKNTRIGNDCVFGQNCCVGPNVIVGNNVKVQNNISIYDGVFIEDDAFLGPSMVFTNVINPRSFINRKDEFKKTLVKKGASIGANVTVVCGVTIGQYAFIGAGSVVTKDVPDFALFYGNPGKVAGWMCYCGTRLSTSEETIECSDCGKKYSLNKEKNCLKML